MTPKERAAMQQALNLLESEWPEGDEIAQPVIDALREALAEQAEQEALKNLVRDMRIDMELKQKVYAALAEQEPVIKYPGCDYCNDELFCGRKCKCCGKVFIEDEDFVQSEVKSLRQQVAALKAVVDAWNNVEQEPVAEVVLRNCKVGFGRTEERKDIVFLTNVEVGTKLYAAPVRTKDITDGDIQKLRHKIDWTAEWSYVNFARAVIAADREKNK